MTTKYRVPPHIPQFHSQPTEDEQLLQRQALLHIPNSDFTRTDPWRVFRIMGEFVNGFDSLSHIGRAVSIFGSARITEADPTYEHARTVARLLGEEGFSIITGGGPGVMEAANRGAQESGTASIGCNIELPFEQNFNPYVTLPIHFRYFFVRKTMFMKYAEAFVIFPGGFGTLDELFEALTLVQTGKVQNFPIFLFGSKYWKPLVDWLKQTVLEEGKISPGDLSCFLVTDSPCEVRDVIVAKAHERNKEASSRQPLRSESHPAPAAVTKPLRNTAR